MTGSAVSFAFVAGTVATVNPCGFALLPAYLARRVGAEDGSRRSVDAVSRALVVGGVTTAGFMLVFGTIGTAIGLGARELTRALPWAGLVIGVALVLGGAAVLSGGHLRIHLPQLRYGGARAGLRGDVLFGIGYGTASLSCTLPIFLAATGSAQQGLARALRHLVPYVNRASGALLLLAGAYVVYYWAFFLLPGSDTRTSGRSLIDGGERFSSQAATWLGSGMGQTVATIVLATIAALVASALWRWLRPDRERRPHGTASTRA